MHQDRVTETTKYNNELVGKETVRELFNFKFNLSIKPPKVTNDKNEQES